MSLTLSISDVLRAHAEVQALACVDLESGAVLVASTRDGTWSDAVEIAAQVAAEICVVPSADASLDEAVPAREAVVVSETGVHAFARPTQRPDLAVVAIARPGMNVALLLASVRGVAAAMVAEMR